MKGNFVLATVFCGLILMTGCGVRSYQPWLDPEEAIKDDRLVGVWMGSCMENTGTDPEGDMVFITGTEYPGLYSITWYSDQELRGDDENPGTVPRPAHLAGALHEVDGVLLAQITGDLTDSGRKNVLIAQLYKLYRVEHVDDTLRLYDLVFPDGVEESGLKYLHEGEGNYVLFSKRDALTEYLAAHVHDPGTFAEKPEIVLTRIRDLRKPAIDPVAPEPENSEK